MRHREVVRETELMACPGSSLQGEGKEGAGQ